MRSFIKDGCCGCGLCVQLCPSKALALVRDAEGFYYPEPVQAERCIDCGLCIQRCPTHLVSHGEAIGDIGAWGGYWQDIEKLRASASGGFAAALTEVVLAVGGIVYGAAYADDYMSVSYIRVTDRCQAERLKGSKYTQAVKGDIYERVKHDLEEGQLVLFIGLPCEVYALDLCLGREYDNLYTCDLICHGPSSERMLQDYISLLSRRCGGKVTHINTRYKESAARPPYMRVLFDSGESYKDMLYSTEYGIAFQVLKRPYCNRCEFKGGKRKSDFTIGDYHAVTPGSVVYNELGVSSIIVHTERGVVFLPCVEDVGFFLRPISLDSARNNRALTEPIPRMPNRAIFVALYQRAGLDAACRARSTVVAEIIRKWQNKRRAYHRALIAIIKGWVCRLG